MAELVNLRLENTLTELEEMQRIGLFSADEIRKIVKKRKDYEYKLHRLTNQRKEDFLNYIEYETSVLALISKRRERLLCESKKQEIDFKISKRINRLFMIAVSRYPDDEKLILDQIQFCKNMKWYDTINALFTQMLKAHSRKPDLWIMAAKWEMEESRSPDNARKLFQRGVVINPESKDLWREYYRMELMYIDLIQKRREVLQLQKMKDPNADENDVVLSGKIPNVVFDNAVGEIDDVEFALSFIQICLEFDFASKQVDYIFERISELYPDQEESLDALAKRPLITIAENIKICKMRGIRKSVFLDEMYNEIFSAYEKAVNHQPTEKMWTFYIDFIMSLTKTAKEKKKKNLQEKLIKIMERAASFDCLSVSFYTEWVDLLFEQGEESDALSISLEAARKWKTVVLWYKALTYHIQCGQPSRQIHIHLLEAINDVPEKDSIILWKLGVDWLSMSDPENLIEFFEIGIKKSKQICVPLKEMYLEHTALRSGIEATRELYKKVKKLGPISYQIICKMVAIEKGQLKSSIKLLREYYEDGIQEFGATNIDIWLDYMRLEVEHELGNPAASGSLIWRAKKALQSEYLNDFQMRLTEFISGNNVPQNSWQDAA